MKILLWIIIALLLPILVCLLVIIARGPTSQNYFLPAPNANQSATPRRIWNVSYTNKNLNCLSEAIFHEAGTEPKIGKEAVGIVIMNRAEVKNTQNICSIVHDFIVIKGKRICQFSYYCLPSSRRINPIAGLNWADSMFIAIKLLNNKVNEGALPLVRDAIYYHADYVKPSWAKNKRFLAKIGNHLFYAEELN